MAVTAMALEGSLSLFIHIPALLITGGAILLAYACHGMGAVHQALGDGIRGCAVDAAGCAFSVHVLNGLCGSFHAMSAAGFGIGVIQILWGCESLKCIALSLAVACLCPLYGILLGEWMVGTLRRRLEASADG